MVEVIDAFVAHKVCLADLVGQLSFLRPQVSAAPSKWHKVFLNLWTSIEIVHTEARIHQRDLTEMELRFVLSLSLELKDTIVAVRGAIAEPLADPVTQ